MTKEPIMIDDVDVSRCKFYDDRYGYCDACRDDIDSNSCTKCMYWDNCYYKQLKRKEQECDQLRGGQRDQNKVIKELKADLEKEKALKQTYLTCYKTKHRDVKGKLFKYENLKQALQEIKEIAQGYKPYKVCGDCNNNCEPINEILQKISEVINEKE